MKRLIIIATVLTFVLLIGATAAWADVFSFDLYIPNTAISGYPSPYAGVTVDLTSPTTANITFVRDDNYFLMDSGIVDVNVNATSWSLSAISGTSPGLPFSGVQLTDGGSGNVDGFGVFNQTLNNKDGFDWALTAVSFTITNTSGTWGGAGEVLTANADGYLAAAHIAVPKGTPSPSNGTLATGFATGDGKSVPEPSLVILLGLGFGAVSLLAYRFKG